MRTRVPTILLLLLASSACHAVAPHRDWSNSLKPKGNPGPMLTLVSNGKSPYSILLSGKPTPQDEKAAADSAQWLKEMTGAEFPIVREGAYKPRGKEISIGRTHLLDKSGISDARADLGNEGYAIAVKGSTLFLFGGKTRGVINAVYALLEEDLGCRWYARDTATIPHAPTLKFSPTPRRFVPVLEIRDPFYWDAFDGTWSLRNRTNSPSAVVPEESGGYSDYAAGMFVHTFASLVPPGRNFGEHPEYFSENDGKRNPNQLCVSNPEVLSLVISRVKEILKENPRAEFISVSQNDSFSCCACPKCKEIADREGSVSGPLLLFVNAVADAVAKDYPDVKISTLAYLDTFMPPKTIKPRPNVAIQLCTDSHAWAEPFLAIPETEKFQKAMKGWAAIGADIYVWDYTVNFSHYLAPMPNMQVVEDDIRFFFKHNAKGVMLQGNYQGPGTSDGLMKSWVWAKQLWDPTRDAKALVRDFTYGYYGAAAEPMQQYQDMLWRIWEENHKGSLAHIGCRYPMDLPVFTREFLDRAGALFGRAKQLAAGNKETVRCVELAELPIIYVELSQMFDRFTKTNDRKEANRFKELLDRFDIVAHREKVTFLWEGAPNTDEWIAKLRQAVRSDSSEILR